MSLPSFARTDGDALLLALKVVPGAKRSQVVGVLGDRLKVRVSAPPEGGKANEAVCQLLQTWLGASRVTLVAGRTQPEKTVRVEGIAETALGSKLTACGISAD